MAKVDELIKRLDKTYDLVYVAYDDKFTEGQIRWILDGQLDRLEEDLDEWQTSCRWESVQYILSQFTGEELDELSADEKDELEQAIFDRDVSDPLTDLARNSPDVDVFMTLLETWDRPYLRLFMKNELKWPDELVDLVLTYARNIEDEPYLLTSHFRLSVSELFEAVKAALWRDEHGRLLVVDKAWAGLNMDIVCELTQKEWEYPSHGLIRPFDYADLEFDNTFTSELTARIEVPNIELAVEQLRTLLVETGAYG